MRQGRRFLRAELPIILATRSDLLSPRMLRVIEELMADWRRLDERIEGLSKEIETVARQDPACERLMTVPGIGPIISSAMVAAIGNGAVFTKGHNFGAGSDWCPSKSRPETARSGAGVDLRRSPRGQLARSIAFSSSLTPASSASFKKCLACGMTPPRIFWT